MKVIIAGGGTGGHLFPAVAVGEELMRERPETEVLFVGTTAGLEARWMPRSGLRYELFPVHGIRGHSLMEPNQGGCRVRRGGWEGARTTRFVWRRPGRGRGRLRVGADGDGGDHDSDATGFDGTEHAAGIVEPDALALRQKSLCRL